MAGSLRFCHLGHDFLVPRGAPTLDLLRDAPGIDGALGRNGAPGRDLFALGFVFHLDWILFGPLRVAGTGFSMLHPDAIWVSQCALATAGRLDSPSWTSTALWQPFLFGTDSLRQGPRAGMAQTASGHRDFVVSRERFFEMLFGWFDSSSKRAGSSRCTGSSISPWIFSL